MKKYLIFLEVRKVQGLSENIKKKMKVILRITLISKFLLKPSSIGLLKNYLDQIPNFSWSCKFCPKNVKIYFAQKYFNNLAIIFNDKPSSHKILVICFKFSIFSLNKLYITQLPKDLANFVRNLYNLVPILLILGNVCLSVTGVRDAQC